MKPFLKREGVQRVLARLIAAYTRLVYRSTQWTSVIPEVFQAYAEAGKPLIVCFWHSRIGLVVNFWRFRMPLYVLGSQHGDGRLIRYVVRHFGIGEVVGSTSRRGLRAIREMVRVIEDGGAVGISPDGPRGPRMRIAPGIITLAKHTQVPIFPVAVSTAWGRALDTWDRFLFPFPFGRGVLIVGEPVSVPAEADDAALEAARITLETRLNAITAEADRRCGREPIEPAPAANDPAGRDA